MHKYFSSDEHLSGRPGEGVKWMIHTPSHSMPAELAIITIPQTWQEPQILDQALVYNYLRVMPACLLLLYVGGVCCAGQGWSIVLIISTYVLGKAVIVSVCSQGFCSGRNASSGICRLHMHLSLRSRRHGIACTCACAYMYMHVHACTCACVYMYMHVHVRICTCMHG